jgi:heptose-I-phosphate ethanolaminephosphotransferase
MRHPVWFLAFALLLPWVVALLLVPDVHESEGNTRVAWLLVLTGLVAYHRTFGLIYLLAPFLLIAGSVDLVYAIVFQGVFSTATFEAIVATNPAEAMEFMAAYSSVSNVSALLLYLSISLLLLRQTQAGQQDRMMRVWLILSLLLLVLLMLRMVDGKLRDSLPGVIGAAFSYQQAHQSVQQEAAHRQALITQYQQTYPPVENAGNGIKTLVVIIGESMSRRHLGLYGYGRNTTPNLQALIQAQPQQWVVFRNIISSHVQTQPALRYALTLANLHDLTDPYQALSVIDLAKLAGFESWWLSNQQPLRGSVSAIAKQADHEYYVSNDHQGIANTLDELLLPKLAEAMAAPATHKLIVVHLMGSHLQYENRYPTTFTQFTDTPPSAYQTQLSTRQVNSINHYDNSIRYTDHLVAQMVRLLPEDHPAALLFFSDHGEEVYDTKNFKGHGPESLSAPMFEIPVLLWYNTTAQRADHTIFAALRAAQHQPSMLDHIDQVISQLLGIRYAQQQPQHTLGHPSWQAHPRRVYGLDYDQVFARNSPASSKD